MWALNRLFSSLLLAVLIIGSHSGCGGGGKSVARSILSSKSFTREVKAAMDGAAFLSTQGDAFVLTFERGKLVVEKTRLLLDDKEIGKLAENAATVDVDFSAGKLNVMADGAQVASVDLKP